MTFIVADRVQETTNSPGTGTVTLLGAVSGYQSFSTGVGINNTTFYVIADQLGTNWEVGLGALNSTGTVLTRTTVYSSSNGGSTVNFATGTQYVWCDYPASKAVLASNNPGTSGQVLTSGGVGVAPSWATAGTVTSVSVVSANGLAGTVATATTTPAITLSTTVTGITKGNGTALSAATAGTDYSVGTSALGTGIVKTTTATGALTVAVAADFPTLNQNTTGSAGSVVNALTIGTGLSGTSYNGSAAVTIANTGVLSFSAGTTGLTPNTATTGAITVAGTLVVGNGGTGLSSYTAGDLPYYASGTALSKLAIGTSGYVLTSSGTAPQWTQLSTIGVTTFSAGTTGLTPSSAINGAVTLAGTLATTNGGTGQSTAAAAFNALSPITSVGDLILGNGVNSATRLAIGLNGQVLTSNGTTASWQTVTGSGTVTSVSGAGGATGLTLTGGPITTSGTLTLGGILNISNGGTGASTASGAINALLPSQTGNSGKILTTNGTSSSWVASGSSGTVTSVSGTGTVNGITLTGTVTAAGSLTLGGTLSGVNLSTQVTGTLPVANGGTGNASLTTGYALIGNGTGPVAGLAPSTSGNIMVSNGTTWTSGTTLAGNYLYTGSNYFQNSTYIGGTSTSTTSLALGTASINFYSSTIGSNVNTSLYFSASGSALANQTYVLTFNNGGSPAYAYSFAGDGTALKTGGGSWGAISDSRLKTNITPLVGALEKINSLNPVSYNWKIVKENEPTVGFIAQDVQKILPNAVTSRIPTEEESEFIVDETMTIGWQNDMFAYLVGAIKELTAEIAELKKT